MMTSTLTPLGDIMASRAGTVDPSQYPNEEFDLYSIPAFDNGNPEVLLGQDIGSTKQVVQPDDVLLSKIVPHIRRAWVVGKNRGRRLIASSEWIVFRNDGFHSPYLRHLLTSDRFHAQFMGTVAGVGGSLLRARPSHVAGISVPLPSLSEQRRIASILDKADAIRRKRREASQLSMSLFASWLETELDLLGPSRAPMVPLEDICSKITDGTHLPPKFKASGIPFIFVKNIVNHRIDFRTDKYIDAQTHQELTKRTPIELGDVLYTTVGVT